MNDSTTTDLVPVEATSPFRRPLTVSRRSVLAGLLGLGVAAFIDTSPLTTLTATAAPRKPNGDDKHKKLTSGNGQIVQPTAYGVLASSELSDDTFATSDVLIGADDRILPFVNPYNNNLVEALVMTGSGLNHLRRDPSQSSGWAYEAFDLQQNFTSVTDVALAASGDSVYVLIFGAPDDVNNLEGSPYWLTWLTGADSWASGYIAPTGDTEVWPLSPGRLKGGVSPQGVPYFYTTITYGSTAYLIGWLPTGPTDQPLEFVTFLTLDVSDPNNGVQDCYVLYDTSGASATNGFAFVLDAGSVLGVYPQQGAAFATAALTNAGSSGVTAVLWAWTSPNNTAGLPGYAFQGNVQGFGEGTFFCDEAGHLTQIGDQPESGANVVAVWQQSDIYTVNLLNSSGVLRTIQEIGAGSWAHPLPLTNGAPGSTQPGLVSVFGVPTDPNQATLFAVSADETLSVLTLDAGGWTQTQVHQSNVVAQPLTCYRLTINLVDANGAALRYGRAQLSTDRPVGLWQDIGSTVLIPGGPLTLTADLSGRIIVSMPAEELDTAVLTVQALDDNGNPTGSPLVVTSDYDVRKFFGGGVNLNDLGTMSGSTLQKLLPSLDSGTATAVCSGINAAITAGIGNPPASSDLKAYHLVFAGKKATLETSKNADAFRVEGLKTAAQLSISHLFASIGHALRHGMATIKSAVVRWVADVKSWVVELATSISDIATYVITDMRDAFHVIGGWFSTLGADIVAGVNWLKREIFGFLSNVGKNATVVGTLLSGGPADLITVVNGIEKQVDGWFVQQETTVTGWITELEGAVETAEFGTIQPLNTPASDTGSATAMNGVGNAVQWIGKVVNDSPGMWLYNKLSQYLPQDPGPDLTGVFDTCFADLITAFDDFVAMGADIANTLWDSLQLLNSRDKASQSKITDWFSDINAVVQRGLQMCDAIADAVLDFVKACLTALGDYLSYQWNLLSINPVLKYILSELGFDPTISISRLVSLVVAFPLTIIREAEGLTPVFSTDQAALRSGHRVGSAQTSDSGDKFCYTLATISQFIWALADAGGDFELVAEEGSTERPQQPGIIDYFDIICPILQTLLLMPGRGDNLIWNGLPTDTNLPGLIAPSILTALISPVFKIAQKANPPATGMNPDVVQYYGGADYKPDPLYQYYGPIVSMLAGIANAITSGWYSYKNASNTAGEIEAIAGSVLGNASNISSWLATWWLNQSTDDLPVIVKLIIDGVGDFGAGAVLAASIPS